MELASLAFDDSSAYAVGTKYANPVYPIARTKYLFDYKQKNPFTIYNFVWTGNGNDEKL